MKKYFLPIVAVAIVAIIMASSYAMAASTPNADPSADSREVTVKAVTQYRTVNFAAAGRCAIFVVLVSGSGVLRVDTADFNPSVYPDWWRATITVVYWGATGTLLPETASSAVSMPSTAYNGVAEMPVYAGLYIKVLISWDRGKTSYTTGTWPATCYIRFRYTGASMTVGGPLPGF